MVSIIQNLFALMLWAVSRQKEKRMLTRRLIGLYLLNSMEIRD